MKKVLYVIAVAAATIFAAGCAREQAASVAAGQDAANVTFTVSAPGIATKAISDGTSATQLTFAVYDDAGNYLKELSENAATVTGANPTWTVTVPVVQQLTYQFVFIAKAATSPYAVDLANKKVTATYGAANDDAADFFYAALKETVGSDLNKSVELVRPLAQVNVGAADLVAAAYSLDVENMTTGLKLTGINNVLNILDGTVSGSADITLAEATRVKEGTTQFVTGYDRIAMGYVLVGEKQTTNATINITAKGKIDGANKVVVRDVPNVPIQANYRTNILGNIFTSNMTFNVVVEPGFDTPEINETLETNIEKANTLFAAGETSVTVDLAPAEGGETTVTLPATTDNVRLNLNITTDKTITVQYAGDAKPAKVEIYAKDVEALVADLASSTVTITAGSHIHNGTFKTAATTLIIEVTAKVDNLVVNAGATKIYGEVATISGDAAADAAYYVKDLAGLQALRDAVNSGVSYKDKTIYLEEDIDLSSIADWEPIGSTDHNFSGIFDGNGKTVSNLTIEYNSPDKAHQGLFGTISSATVQNINVNNVNINVQSSGSGAAAVVGYSAGSTKVLNVHVKNVTIRANRWGGGVANGYATIQNCSSDNVDILLVPNVKDDSFDNGDKGGGIVGWHGEGTIEISGNTANNVTIRGYRDIGGITGIAHNNNIVKNNTVTNSTIIRDAFTNAYADESKNAGKVIGRYYSAVTEEGNVAGDDVEVIGLLAEGVTVDIEGNYHITSAEGLTYFATKQVNDKTIYLDTDIDYNNAEWAGVTVGYNKTLVIDGQNHTIKNLKLLNHAPDAQSSAARALVRIAYPGSNLTVKNLTLDGIVAEDGTYNGAIVGYCQGTTTIDNVTVINSSFKGTKSIGGLIGYKENSSPAATIKNCTVSNSTVTATTYNAGGFIGRAHNGKVYIIDSSVSGNTIVSAQEDKAGELIGDNYPSLPSEVNISNVYVNGVLYVLTGVSYDDETGYAVDDDFESDLNDIIGKDGDANSRNLKDIVVNLDGDVILDVNARNNILTIGNDETETVTINLNGHTLTFNNKNSDWNDVSALNAKLILKNGKITNSGCNDGPWNRHDINFGCDVELEDIYSDKAIAFKANGSMKNVTIEDSRSNEDYALWIQPNVDGQTVIVDSCKFIMNGSSGDRGITVNPQYLSAADVKTVSLTVTDSIFKTGKKSAVYCKSSANVTWGTGNDISGVAADSVNPVWRADDATGEVTGTGFTLYQE